MITVRDARLPDTPAYIGEPPDPEAPFYVELIKFDMDDPANSPRLGYWCDLEHLEAWHRGWTHFIATASSPPASHPEEIQQ